jgi:hypothetical protein
MNKWLKNTVILFQVGGGLLGLGLIGRAILTEQLTQSSVVIHAGFFFIFSFGIVAGISLIKNQNMGLLLSTIFQAIQIPTILTSTISYNMFSGAIFNIYRHETGYGSNFYFGSRYYFNLNSDTPWLFGINVIALILFVLLIREILYEAWTAKLYQPQQRRVYSEQHSEQIQNPQTDCSPIRHRVPGAYFKKILYNGE